ncbi:oligosaccharyltransferase complex subunit epsilon [Coniosporium apollinis]|uniref:Dolichyl-diphosphooligosaccharide--protein glycosyltransferase subunit OST2 n=2 Tax=Coniosporium TaxID=2810619 RepID=A0ABQ9P3N6_9PEZI|nr:oligosaccharyltransferase complex subunit epsilon [Cladosporium sp. JES 115]KAJ9669211.1 oligosaccharyltransferase complex subunit epsilon [Coniosporium apollinis]
MAPKPRAPVSPAAVPPSAMTSAHITTSAASQTTRPTSSQPTKPATNPAVTSPSSPTKSPSSASAKSSLRNASDAQAIVQGVWQNYVDRTPQRVKLMDAFMGFLVVVGVVQFVYCVLAGNYPFNAFLSGFSATVGQFVLTASLRIQTNPENRKEFESISDERAFADYVFGSVLLHFFCVNFIN